MNLKENGFDSFKKAIHNLKKLDELSGIEREFIAKDIILNLHHSVETLFKYLIKEKNELLIYDDLNDYFQVKMNIKKNKGSKYLKRNTITFMQAVIRVIELYNLQVNKTVFGSFEHLNQIRNAITHYEYDLEDKKINYLITQVITALFPIYKELLPTFAIFVRQHDLNLVGSSQVKELHVWKFIRFLTLYQKFVDGKKEIDTILQTDGEFQKKQAKIKKEDYITYHECPCCKKNFFLKEALVIEEMEEKGYTGSCSMCDITLDKEDSYFLYLISEDYYSFNDDFKKGYVIIKDLLDDEDLNTKITSQELIDIKNIYSKTESGNLIAQTTNNYLMNKLHDILEPYSEEIVYNYDVEEMDNALYTRKYTDDQDIELTEDDCEKFKRIFENLQTLELTEDFYDEALEMEYTYYHYRSHPDPHNDNEEVEIEIELSLTCNTIFLEI